MIIKDAVKCEWVDAGNLLQGEQYMHKQRAKH